MQAAAAAAAGMGTPGPVYSVELPFAGQAGSAPPAAAAPAAASPTAGTATITVLEYGKLLRDQEQVAALEQVLSSMNYQEKRRREAQAEVDQEQAAALEQVLSSMHYQDKRRREAQAEAFRFSFGRLNIYSIH
jgi:hypothetical protein